MSPTQMELGVSGKSEAQKEPKDLGKPFNFAEFLKEAKVEFGKISWPSKEQATREFFSVLLLVAILTAIIFIIDKIFGVIANFFMGRLY